ncbi:MAG: hypothetical protein U1A22_04065 [Xanthomonadaceae bacterium]|nr:hypothetical protein [Xanthomonadaceae bacterium]
MSVKALMQRAIQRRDVALEHTLLAESGALLGERMLDSLENGALAQAQRQSAGCAAEPSDRSNGMHQAQVGVVLPRQLGRSFHGAARAWRKVGRCQYSSDWLGHC